MNNATAWQINAVDGGYTISTTATNGSTYYVGYTSGWGTPSLSASTTSSVWQYDAEQRLLYCYGGFNNRAYYLGYSSNSWRLNSSSTKLTFTYNDNSNSENISIIQNGKEVKSQN